VGGGWELQTLAHREGVLDKKAMMTNTTFVLRLRRGTKAAFVCLPRWCGWTFVCDEETEESLRTVLLPQVCCDDEARKDCRACRSDS
jgi:hypothetical protein